MTIRYRKRLRFGPLVFYFTQRGFSSAAIKVGPLTYNFRSGRRSVDLPGGASWSSTRKRPAPPQ